MGKTRLLELLDQRRREKYPEALQIQVIQNEKVVFRASVGRTYKYFDIGSITKMMVTAALVMRLIDDKKLSLGDKLEKHLGFLKGRAAGKVAIKDLLRHWSGLVWWRPYFKTLSKLASQDRIPALKKILSQEKVKRGRKCVYSDPDFIFLGWVIEAICHESLDSLAWRHLFEPLKMKNTFFLRRKSNQARLFAPTTRKRQGEVFDDNTWAMGGVGGHAGLFSTLEETSRFGLEILRAYQGKSSKVFKSKTVRQFVKRATPKSAGDWGLGFYIPSRPVSTAGTKVSSRAFGHVGYSGTSLWIDPTRNAVVTILSNGTYPGFTNKKFAPIRRELHDAIWEMLDG